MEDGKKGQSHLYSIIFYSHIFIYGITRRKTNHMSAISNRKKKGLKKARNRGKRARKNLSTGFYRETIPQERTS